MKKFCPKGPRMKMGQFTQQVITESFWKRFRKMHPEYADKKDKELNDIWNDIAKTIRDEVVNNPLGVKLGSYTGEIKYQFLPHKFKALSVKEIALGNEVRHTNLLTRGKVALVKWERRWAVKFNKMLQYYAFEPMQVIKKRLKEYTDNNPDKIRTSRNTLGGYSVWRQLGKK